MKVSFDGRSIIEQFEGCEKSVKNRPGFYTTYRDEVGVLTVCFGCTNLSGSHAPIVEGAVYSRSDCDALLSSDLQGFEQRVAKIMSGVALKQNQFDALVSFDFNTGGLDKSSIPAKIRAGQLDQVPPTLDRWNKAGGQVYAGLTRRRKSEGQEFAGDVAGALATAGVHRGSGDSMPQKIDRPRVPAGNVAAATKREQRGAAGGGAIAGGGAVGTGQPDSAPSTGIAAWAALALGLAILAACAWLAWRKWRALDADWA